MRKRAGLPGRVAVLSIKHFDSDNVFAGYDLLLLPAEQRLSLARLAVRQSAEKSENGWFGFRRFRFNQTAFNAALQMISGVAGASEYLVDEVGPMELGGGGFAPVVELLLKERVDLVLSVRPTLLSEIPAHFGFEPAEIIRL